MTMQPRLKAENSSRKSIEPTTAPQLTQAMKTALVSHVVSDGRDDRLGRPRLRGRSRSRRVVHYGHGLSHLTTSPQRFGVAKARALPARNRTRPGCSFRALVRGRGQPSRLSLPGTSRVAAVLLWMGLALPGLAAD